MPCGARSALLCVQGAWDTCPPLSLRIELMIDISCKYGRKHMYISSSILNHSVTVHKVGVCVCVSLCVCVDMYMCMYMCMYLFMHVNVYRYILGFQETHLWNIRSIGVHRCPRIAKERKNVQDSVNICVTVTCTDLRSTLKHTVHFTSTSEKEGEPSAVHTIQQTLQFRRCL